MARVWTPESRHPSLALGAVAVTARVISDPFEGALAASALAASFDMTTQDRGPARLDGAHHFEMFDGQAVPGAIAGSLLAEDVSQLQRWLRHSGY